MTTVSELAVGDVIALELPTRTVAVTIASIEPNGSYAMGTRTPIMRITFTDAPRVIRALEKAADATVERLSRRAVRGAEARAEATLATFERQVLAIASAEPILLAIDEDCPGCGWPERRFDTSTGLYGCAKCSHVGQTRAT